MSARNRRSPSAASSGAPARYRSLPERGAIHKADLGPDTIVFGAPVENVRGDDGYSAAELKAMGARLLADLGMSAEEYRGAGVADDALETRSSTPAPPVADIPARKGFLQVETFIEVLGLALAETETRATEAIQELRAELLAPQARSAPDTSPFVRLDTITEAVGIALAEIQTRATRALQELRDELLDRIAEIERRGG